MEWALASVCVWCMAVLVYVYTSQMRWVKRHISYFGHREFQQETNFSIVLCARNPSLSFSKYLLRFLVQDYTAFELIVVYHDLGNGLLSELSELEKSQDHLRLIALDESSPYLQKKQALNLGIRHARYDWIVTTDDDCYPESEVWLKKLNYRIQSENPDILLGLSPSISQSGWLNKWIRYDGLMGAWNMVYYSLSGRPYMGIGRNMAFRKGLWSAPYLEKFKDLGHADDTTLVQYHSDKKIIVFTEEKVYSFSKNSLKDWIHQKLRHISAGQTMKTRQWKDLAQLPMMSFIFWLTIWIWMSYFHIGFLIFFIMILYLSVKVMIIGRMEKLLGMKKKIFPYTLFFDFFHSAFILMAPIVSIFRSKSWRQ